MAYSLSEQDVAVTFDIFLLEEQYGMVVPMNLKQAILYVKRGTINKEVVKAEIAKALANNKVSSELADELKSLCEV